MALLDNDRPSDVYSMRNGFVVTKDDDNDLQHVTRRIICSSDGVINVFLVNDVVGDHALAIPVKAAVPLEVRARRIFATGTTVTGAIIALY